VFCKCCLSSSQWLFVCKLFCAWLNSIEHGMRKDLLREAFHTHTLCPDERQMQVWVLGCSRGCGHMQSKQQLSGC
jgi:hypothetical protein